jgi:hypothetical protein
MPVEVRVALGARSSASAWRLSRRENTGRRLTRERAPAQRLHVRKHTTLAHALLPAGCQVSVRFDSW